MIERFGKIVSRAGEAICAAMFVLVFLAFIYKIGARYVFGGAIAWADEICVILFIWIIFIANAFVVPDNRQLCFDLLYRNLGDNGRRKMAIFRIAVIGGIFAWCLPGAVDYILFLWRERTSALYWRLDYVYICFAIFMVATVARLAGQLLGLIAPRWRQTI